MDKTVINTATTIVAAIMLIASSQSYASKQTSGPLCIGKVEGVSKSIITSEAVKKDPAKRKLLKEEAKEDAFQKAKSEFEIKYGQFPDAVFRGKKPKIATCKLQKDGNATCKASLQVCRQTLKAVKAARSGPLCIGKVKGVSKSIIASNIALQDQTQRNILKNEAKEDAFQKAKLQFAKVYSQFPDAVFKGLKPKIASCKMQKNQNASCTSTLKVCRQIPGDAKKVAAQEAAEKKKAAAAQKKAEAQAAAAQKKAEAQAATAQKLNNQARANNLARENNQARANNQARENNQARANNQARENNQARANNQARENNQARANNQARENNQARANNQTRLTADQRIAARQAERKAAQQRAAEQKRADQKKGLNKGPKCIGQVQGRSKSLVASSEARKNQAKLNTLRSEAQSDALNKARSQFRKSYARFPDASFGSTKPSNSSCSSPTGGRSSCTAIARVCRK